MNRKSRGSDNDTAMLRGEKKIQDGNLIKTILTKALICRIGLADENHPYVVPMCFVHAGDAIYLHAAPEGRKIEILKQNAAVCFEVESDVAIVPADSPCGWGMQYRSVVGFGKATFVDNPEEKIAAFDLLMEKYSGRGGWTYPDKAVRRTTIIRIGIEQITGKQSGF